MASSYRKYSDLGVTQAEKQQQQLAQIRAMEAQKTIEEQQQRLQEQEAKIHKIVSDRIRKIPDNFDPADKLKNR